MGANVIMSVYFVRLDYILSLLSKSGLIIGNLTIAEIMLRK